MSKTKSQIITLAEVSALNKNNQREKPIVWTDFGVYLDKKLEHHIDPNDKKRSAAASLSGDSSFLSQNINYRICKSCERPVGEQSLRSHYLKCIEMRHRKQAELNSNTNSETIKKKRGRATNSLLDVDNSSVDSSRNSTPNPGTPSGSGRPKKKYKKSQSQKEKEAANAAAAAAAAAAASTDGTLSAGSDNVVSKKKKQTKPKTTAKPKGPVDVEKQCGVPLPSGGFCARSLTCKTHSMGAKRAVMGRSAPYDVLLQQYQKRNQAKLAANNALAAQRRENAAFHGNGSAFNEDLNGTGYSKILDPDEETHLVLEGLSKNNPMPLEEKVIMSTRYRHRFLAMREFYADSLITSGGNSGQNGQAGAQNSEQTLANQAISGSIGGLQGRCALINVDTNSESTQSISSVSGEMYQVRAPLKAVLLTAQYNAMQQQMFQQQVMKLQQQQQMLLRQRQARAAAAKQDQLPASTK
ncbi:uncharacterized protein PRCAT00000160001 [Priceomyces carsonii]|uniref:uncharacterized protein n=1 Tax=Priceomyces carsonii TaxID=28549 RepID=UPI002ED7802A|nr:unnamed protein product [Priceomyces carsonii]